MKQTENQHPNRKVKNSFDQDPIRLGTERVFISKEKQDGCNHAQCSSDDPHPIELYKTLSH